jgi:hypothetical protein
LKIKILLVASVCCGLTMAAHARCLNDPNCIEGSAGPYSTSPYSTSPYSTSPYSTSPYSTSPYSTSPYAADITQSYPGYKHHGSTLSKNSSSSSSNNTLNPYRAADNSSFTSLSHTSQSRSQSQFSTHTSDSDTLLNPYNDYTKSYLSDSTRSLYGAGNTHSNSKSSSVSSR